MCFWFEYMKFGLFELFGVGIVKEVWRLNNFGVLIV